MILGLTEAWMQDFKCDLCNQHGYSLTENHGSEMSGGEVEFAVGDFLVVFNDLIESVFIEIPKNVLKRDENMIFLQEVICSCLMLCLQIFRKKKSHREQIMLSYGRLY